MKNVVAIVDYGMCNLDSVRRAVEECGGQARLLEEGGRLGQVDRIILPGVGAFPDAMAELKSRSLVDALNEEVMVRGTPVLGICLGMQLLASTGFEGGGPTPGLGWVPGTVRRLSAAEGGQRVPHVGWNEVEPRGETTLFAGITPGTDFYFVHSYHVVCEHDRDVAATTPYGGSFCSAVESGTIFGVQFHPEKSQSAGFRLLGNFLSV